MTRRIGAAEILGNRYNVITRLVNRAIGDASRLGVDAGSQKRNGEITRGVARGSLF